MEAMEIQARNNETPHAHVFTPADVARAFRADYLDEAVCRRWILTTIHGAGAIACPECRAPLTGIALRRFWEGKRICCRACGKFFTALTGTFLAGCHFNFQEIILLAVFLYFRIPKYEIVRRLKISGEAVRLWEIKFTALERVKGTDIDHA